MKKKKKGSGLTAKKTTTTHQPGEIKQMLKVMCFAVVGAELPTFLLLIPGDLLTVLSCGSFCFKG